MAPSERPLHEVDAAALHRRVAAGFTARAEQVRDWSAPAPVEGWTARDVVGHLVDWFPAFLAAGGVNLSSGPAVEDDPVGAWRRQVDAVQALLDDPETAAAPFEHPRVPVQPLGSATSAFYTADVFMHTWDLARAAGLDEHLDEDFCAHLLAGMEPMEELMRGSGQYGPRVPVPDDADARTRLLGFIGRHPG
jgi:uncharacterized protein (TIGR03086 family)